MPKTGGVRIPRDKRKTAGGYPTHDKELRMMLGTLETLSPEQKSLIGKISRSRKFTAKLKKMILYVSRGMSKTKAAIKAGYSSSPVGFRAYARAKQDIEQLMEGCGISDLALVKHLHEGLRATKLCGIGAEVEAPDWSNRHKYLETSLKLKGHLKDPSQMGPFNVGSIVLIRPGGNGQNGEGKRKVINARPSGGTAKG